MCALIGRLGRHAVHFAQLQSFRVSKGPGLPGGHCSSTRGSIILRLLSVVWYGVRLRSYCLCSKHFMKWAISPAPAHKFLIRCSVYGWIHTYAAYVSTGLTVYISHSKWNSSFMNLQLSGETRLRKLCGQTCRHGNSHESLGLQGLSHHPLSLQWDGVLNTWI